MIMYRFHQQPNRSSSKAAGAKKVKKKNSNSSVVANGSGKVDGTANAAVASSTPHKVIKREFSQLNPQ